MNKNKSFFKINPNLLDDQKQVNLFLKDMLNLTKKELVKTKHDLNTKEQLHQKTTNILFDIEQQNEFLKDIGSILDSKIKIPEESSLKPISNSSNNIPKMTKKMYHDQQMPLLSIESNIKHLNDAMEENFSIDWLKDFQKLEDNVLLAKLQIEEIIDSTQKESLV